MVQVFVLYRAAFKSYPVYQAVRVVIGSYIYAVCPVGVIVKACRCLKIIGRISLFRIFGQMRSRVEGRKRIAGNKPYGRYRRKRGYKRQKLSGWLFSFYDKVFGKAAERAYRGAYGGKDKGARYILSLYGMEEKPEQSKKSHFYPPVNAQSGGCRRTYDYQRYRCYRTAERHEYIRAQRGKNTAGGDLDIKTGLAARPAARIGYIRSFFV